MLEELLDLGEVPNGMGGTACRPAFARPGQGPSANGCSPKPGLARATVGDRPRRRGRPRAARRNSACATSACTAANLARASAMRRRRQLAHREPARLAGQRPDGPGGVRTGRAPGRWRRRRPTAPPAAPTMPVRSSYRTPGRGVLPAMADEPGGKVTPLGRVCCAIGVRVHPEPALDHCRIGAAEMHRYHRNRCVYRRRDAHPAQQSPHLDVSRARPGPRRQRCCRPGRPTAADDARNKGGEPDSIVQVANLVYAGVKSSHCFSDHFLSRPRRNRRSPPAGGSMR